MVSILAKVLVTGGAGFIGRKLIKLLQKNHQVRVTDIMSHPSDIPKEVEYFQLDLAKQKDMSEVFEGIDVCVNLAAKIGGVGYMAKYPGSILNENIKIIINTFNAAVKHNIKQMMFASSSMVFQNATAFPSKEEDADKVPPPKNIYGFSKLVGEYFCKAYNKEFGLPYTIFRIFNCYGVGEDIDKEISFSHVIPDLTKKILSGQYPLEILGDGTQSRPFTHVTDIVQGIALLVENHDAINDDFNIGSEIETKIIDLANILWNLCGRKEPFRANFLPEFEYTTQRRACDNSKLKKLGWRADVGLKDGLNEFVNFVRNTNNMQRK